jgi:RNA-directed DNA polymerase
VRVAVNLSHKDGHPSAERGEGRAWTQENASPARTCPTPRGTGVSQGWAGVRQVARARKRETCTALLPQRTIERLRDRCSTRKRHAAPGMDGVTWQTDEHGMEERLADRHRRVHRGASRAPPARRVYMPTSAGGQRPLGSAALADTSVQQAVVPRLPQIDEEDFVGCSDGFRPGRRPHQALAALSVALTRKRVKYVLAYDRRACVDQLSHAWLVNFLQHRVGEPRVLRRSQQWLRAGVSADGQWSEATAGGPQGAVAAPLLANVSLHAGFDLWVDAWRKKGAQGAVVVVRDADAGVVGFEPREAAERFRVDLPARFRQFGLAWPPDQTRLIEYGPHAIANRQPRGEGTPATVALLGFTHSGERHRKTGDWIVRRQTARKRLVAMLKARQQQLRQRRHAPLAETGQGLGSIVQGYFNSHAGPGHTRPLGSFRRRVRRLWRRQRCLRRQKTRLNWRRCKGLIHRWMPPQRLLHPFPRVRVDAMHPREEPYAGVPHVRICAGGAG